MEDFSLSACEPEKKAKRRALDAYYTPPILTQALIDEFPEIRGKVLGDPCSGDGRMSQHLIKAGRFERAILNDLASGGLDATRAESWERWKGADWVVTNIPFVHSGTIPWRAIEAGIPAALLMRITFLEPVEDRQWLLRCPPVAMLALPRVSFTGTGATDSTIWAIVVAVAFSVGPWVPDAAASLVKRSRGRKKTDDWGPAPEPPAFTRWTRCSECRATYAHEVLLGVRESWLCKRCKEQERLPL